MKRPAVILRPLRPGDAEALARIAYRTAYFGDIGTRFFPDEQLFADLWVRPYLLSGGGPGPVGLGFVAETVPAEGEGGLLGYVLGAGDAAAYARAITRTVWHVIFGTFTGRYPRFFGCLPYLTRAALYHPPAADPLRYPAHLHLNLLPQARGLGLGGQLLAAYLDELRRRGVPGVHLSTTRENRAAVALYTGQGFTVAGERTLPLWTPWLGHPADHLTMVRALGAR